MMAKLPSTNLRTWIEIDSRAAKRNYDTFRKILAPKAKLWSVVKSNAYGHGLVTFSKLLDRIGASPVRSREGSQRVSTSNGVDGFCVDSLVEGIRLRKEGIKKPVLVLGPTLPALLPEAAKHKIAITISNPEALKALVSLANSTGSGSKKTPEFHIKIDTGMHRQGFYLQNLPNVLKEIRNPKSEIRNKLAGIYTHFASAKDVNYPTYTERQFAEFQKAIKLFEQAGFNNLTKHCAATGATLLSPEYHLDAVRVGIGLYGLWPSKELEMQLGQEINPSRLLRTPFTKGRIKLRPVLSWRALVSEVKPLQAGDFVGYDLVERISRPTRVAIIPVGYWHGFPRVLSGIGEVLINGKRARVLGRVSMDLLAVDAAGTGAKVGDVATLVGKEGKEGKKGKKGQRGETGEKGKEEIKAFDAAAKAGTIHYELLTRLNPLIERVLI